MSAQCPRCGEIDAPEAHIVECAHRAEKLTELKAYASHLDQPPHPATVLDLHAHMYTRVHDLDLATLLARAVLDLGWRPTVGAA